MSNPNAPGPRIYRSKDIEPLIPRNESVWQYYLRCNPDLVPNDKVILQEQENPTAQLTYGEMREKASKGAAGLQKLLGLKEGDVLAIWGENSVNWALAAHAGMWAGITVAGINLLASPYELVHYLHVAEPQVFFADSAIIPKFREAQRLDPSGRLSQLRVVSLDAGVAGQADILQWPQDFLNVGSAPVLDLSNRDNKTVPAVICFSSGTSGNPKGALLSHHSMIGYVTGPRCFGSSSLSRNDVEVFYAPLCHIYGMVTAVLAPAFIGHLMVIMRAYKFHEYIKACQENQATVMRVVPPTAMAIAKDPSMKGLNLSSVHTLVCAGAALGEETQAGLQRLLKGVNVIQGYGMSEGAITFLKSSYAREKSGSVGTPFPLVEMRLVDDDLKDVPEGKTGEILCHGPTTFMGYKNNPEATAEAFPFGDQWMRTGDIGHVDEDGFWWITDRKKELIKYKGNQVPPAELEDVLMQFPDVAEAAVCAAWDDRQETEIPVGYVSFRPSVKADERPKKLKEVQAFVNGRVAPYKKLRGGVHFLEAIPRNATGKILRRQLPARIEMEKRKAKL